MRVPSTSPKVIILIARGATLKTKFLSSLFCIPKSRMASRINLMNVVGGVHIHAPVAPSMKKKSTFSVDISTFVNQNPHRAKWLLGQV